MHAGFTSLRSQMGMNLRQPFPGTVPSAETQADIDRIEQIWQHCRQRHGAPGRSCWPVHDCRCHVCAGAPLSVPPRRATAAIPARPIDHMLELPALRAWYAAAAAEPQVIASLEPARP